MVGVPVSVVFGPGVPTVAQGLFPRLRDLLFGDPSLEPRQIEAIDRERTKLHNEGAELMAQRPIGAIDIDQPTASRLFALVSALRWRV